MSMDETVKYKPMRDISTGAWYAARRIPGCHTWHGEVECMSEAAAQKACDALNKIGERVPSRASNVINLGGQKERQK